MLSGSPSANGNFSFTVQVQDKTAAKSTLDATLVIAAAGTSPSVSGVLAQVASGGGWTTSIYLINPSSSAAKVTVNFLSDNGTALALPLNISVGGTTQTSTEASIDDTIPANGVMLILTTSPSATEQSGWAQVLGPSSVKGYAVFQFLPAGGTESEGTVPLDQSGQATLLLPFDNTNGLQTAVALANALPSHQIVTAIAWMRAARN